MISQPGSKDRWGTRQARQTVRTLSELRPAEQLESLERLAHVARTDTERAQFREIMRGLRRKLLERGIVGADTAIDVLESKRGKALDKKRPSPERP